MADFTNRIELPPLFRPIPVPALQPKRHVFISSFHANRQEVDGFIYKWATVEKVFTPKALCTFDNDDFIDSDKPEYVMAEIRRKYLLDSSVTIFSSEVARTVGVMLIGRLSLRCGAA